jgi:sulfide:quinone oxidoreductase
MSGKNLVILGGGTAGSMVANRLIGTLDGWTITVVDRSDIHYYQPGYLFIPFGMYSPEDVYKQMDSLLDPRINLVYAAVEAVIPERNEVTLRDGSVLAYDALVIATGTDIEPSAIDGLLDAGWYTDIFDFYSFEGAVALEDRLKHFTHGRLVVSMPNTPVKGPLAPLEFAFLADAYFTERGTRHLIDIVYTMPTQRVTPPQLAADKLEGLAAERGIHLVRGFEMAAVDGARAELVSAEGERLPYDLLTVVPPNYGASFVETSGIGDALRYIPTDPYTLQAAAAPNIFVVGDATDIRTAKGGSVAHYQLEVLVENLLATINGHPPPARYDGHANCFVETGNGKGILLDFDYENEPMPGNYPFPSVGPMRLLEETRMNHMGKMAFRWIYWNLLVRGKDIPVIPHALNMDAR